MPRGDEIVPVLNRYMKEFESAKALLIATRDWHPSNHASFKPYGGIWPVHCVQNTPGAEFHPKLSLSKNVMIISKGTEEKKEAYSGFDETNLTKILKKNGVRIVWVGGLATDYCVKSTVLDGIKAGFRVTFLADASRGVDLNAGDSEKAITEMLAAGAEKATLADLE